MTSRVSAATGSFYGASYDYSSRIGTDGKTETVSGVTRDKWNNYTVVDHHGVGTMGKTSWCNIGGYPNINTLFTAADQNRLLAKLADKVRGHSFNLGVELGQAKQTGDLIWNTAKQLALAARNVRKGQLTSALKNLGLPPGSHTFKTKDAAGRWLELQYGWLPLLGSVKDAAEAYAALTSLRKSRIVVQIRKNGLHDGSQSPTLYSGFGQYRATNRIIYEMTEDISTARSLGLLDPLSVAWELMPWSFVADWFIPIGTYLDNLSIIPKLKGRFLTTKTMQYSNSLIVKANFNFYGGATARTRRFDLIRTTSTSLSVPFPGFSPLDEAFSARRVYNAVALLTQAITGNNPKGFRPAKPRAWESGNRDPRKKRRSLPPIRF